MDIKVGDQILFDHFGSKDRRGSIVKITKSAIHVEWMAPSSGKVRVVRIGTQPTFSHGSTNRPEYLNKNIRIELRPTGVWKNYQPFVGLGLDSDGLKAERRTQ